MQSHARTVPNPRPRRFDLFLLFALLGASAGCAHAVEPDEVLQDASAWREGDEVPPDLLAYRARTACLHLPSDSAPMIGEIVNVPLLLAIILDPAADDGLADLALERALQLVGPGRVFSALTHAYASDPARASTARHAAMAARAREPHAWVSAIYITAADMPEPEARYVLEQVAERLHRGEPWEAVYREVAERHSGRAASGPKVGNLGSFVVSRQKRDAAPFRITVLPAEHVQSLLAARPGETRLLPTAEALMAGVEGDAVPRLVLYHIREVYPGREM